MTTPIGRHIRVGLESVRDAMVDLLLVRVRLGIALADAFRDHTRIALGMASVLAVLTLHTGRIFEEVSAKGTTHDVVELVLHELVAVHLMNLLLSLTNGTLSAEAEIDGPPVLVCLVETHLELDLPRRLQVEPSVDGPRHDLRLGTRHSVRTLATLASLTSLGTW